MRYLTVVLPLLVLLAACGREEETQAPTGSSAKPAAGTSETAQLKPGTTYYFGTAQRWTNIQFDTKTSLGSMSGSTRSIEGSASVGADGKSGSCSFVVPADSVTTGQDGIDSVMRREEKWLNTATFKTIEFKADEASFDNPPRGWTVKGKFTLKGIPQDLEFKADVLPIPASLVEKLKMGEGDWVRVKTKFQLKLSDYKIIVPSGSTARIDDIVNISVDVFGTTKKPDASGAAQLPTQPVIRPTAPDYTKLDSVEGKLYRFNVKSQLTTLKVTSKTPMETLMARTCMMAGKAKMDMEKGTGKVVLSVPAGGFFTDLRDVNTAMYGKGLLDVEQHRDILFESTKLERKEGDAWALEGTLKILGRDVKIATDAEVRVIPAEIVRKNRWSARGDGIKFVAKLTFKLADLGMAVPEALAGRLGDEVIFDFDAIVVR